MNSEKIALYKALRRCLFWGSIVLFLALAALSFFWWSYAAPLAVVTLVWFVLGARMIPTQERWTYNWFGAPYEVAESGLGWFPLGISSPSKFTAGRVRLPYSQALEFWTKATPDFGTVTGHFKPEMSFFYPKDDGLLKTAKLLPDPTNIEGLCQYFQEALYEDLRTLAGEFTYVDLKQQTGDFQEKVISTVINGNDSKVKRLLREVDASEVMISIGEIVFPKEVVDSFMSVEVARRTGAALLVTTKAEAEREVLLGRARGESQKAEGAGVRDAKKMLYDLVLENPKNIATLAMFTMQEMAQGPATTIFPISTDLMSDFRDIMGRQSPSSREVVGVLESLPEGLRNELTRLIVAQLKPKTPAGAK